MIDPVEMRELAWTLALFVGTGDREMSDGTPVDLRPVVTALVDGAYALERARMLRAQALATAQRRTRERDDAARVRSESMSALAYVTYAVPIGGMANRVLMRAIEHATTHSADRVMFCGQETTIRVAKGDSFDDAWGRWSARADVTNS